VLLVSRCSSISSSSSVLNILLKKNSLSTQKMANDKKVRSQQTAVCSVCDRWCSVPMWRATDAPTIENAIRCRHHPEGDDLLSSGATRPLLPHAQFRFSQ